MGTRTAADGAIPQKEAGIVAIAPWTLAPLRPLVFIAIAGFAFLEPSLAQEAVVEGRLAADEGGIELTGTEIPEKSIRALMMLLVLAILIESGLSVIFDWTVYRAYFAKSALKPVIAVIVSFLVVRTFELDILAELLESYGTEVDSVLLTQFLTALVLAGGSGTVNRVRHALGLKETASEDMPPAKHGWLSVRVERGRAIKGPVRVMVTEVAETPADQEAIAGIALARRPSLSSLLFRNNNRFPENGGYALDPEKTYKVAVVGESSDGTTVRREITDGPIKLAAGAIVDFDVTLQAPR